MDHSLPPSEPARPPLSAARGWILSGVVVGLATLTCAVLVWSLGKDTVSAAPQPAQAEFVVPPSVSNAPPVPLPVIEEPPSVLAVETPATSPIAEELPGIWTMSDGIERRIDLRADGTATMHVVLDALSSFIYGSQLTLEIDWTLEPGQLTYTLTGGQPADKVDLLMAHFGHVQTYRILEYSECDILLELTADGKQYRWQRVQPCAQP